MNVIKKALLFIVIVVLSGVLPITSFAQGAEQSERPTEGTESPYVYFGEGNIKYQLEIGTKSQNNYLKNGFTFIQSNGGNTVHVSGSTTSFETVDIIGINLYLQRWNATASQWEDVVAVGESINQNASNVNSGFDVTIAKGYYYRTRALHWIEKGGIVEQNNSVTSHIYIDK